jgi:hypothetical protein
MEWERRPIFASTLGVEIVNQFQPLGWAKTLPG